ncbi:MAG: signal peptidase [Gaiellaceae bacterium]|jgi:signal peptidase I|nr:signal peptidase [Gaiellaceae bacterium]
MRIAAAVMLTALGLVAAGCGGSGGASIARNLIRLGARSGDHAFRIPSSSMEPTFHCARPAPGCEAGVSDRILVRPYSAERPPRRGDIAALRTPPAAEARCGAGGTFVKRLIGLPGETVRESDGIISINGRDLHEPYIAASRRDHEPARTWHVHPGEYFVVGDNRAASCDSRVWGSVPRANLIGRTIGIYWPASRFGRM